MKLIERLIPRDLPSTGVAAIASGLLACSASHLGTGTDGGDNSDGGVDSAPAGDGGEASVQYPAFEPPVPQFVLVAPNGTVMKTPHVRPVYFSGESWVDLIDAPLAQWLPSAAWKAQTSEYGIGAATLDTPIMLTETPPAMLAHDDIQTWLEGKLDGTHAEFGPVDAAALANEIFLLFYPAATTITAFGGTSCATFGGYHDETPVGASYVVLPRCPGTAAQVEYTASYEALATAGNPLPRTQPGYFSFDAAHLAWNALWGDPELPGPCSGYAFNPNGGPPLLPDPLSWSNAAIRGYHDPCVLMTGSPTPYFASVPVMNDDVAIVLSNQTYSTKGIKVPVNQSVQVDVQLLSDRTTADWTVNAQVMPNTGMPANALGLQLDGTKGHNGDTLHLTVTAKQSTPVLFVVTSTLDTKTTVWAGVVN
jgi:hypothetical protein